MGSWWSIRIPTLEEIDQYPRGIADIPEKSLTPEMCAAAVRSSPSTIRDIPQHMRTPELAMIAFEDKYVSVCDVLESLPEESRTRDVCWEAMKLDVDALDSAPSNVLTQEFCVSAMSWATHNRTQLARKFPPSFWDDRDFCYRICLACGDWRGLLDFVPPDSQTPEFLCAAVRGSQIRFQKIDEYLLTPKICEVAVRANPGNFRFVPPQISISPCPTCSASGPGPI